MKINAGFYQFCPEFKNNEANLEKVTTRLSSVNNALIVLPELAFSGYNFLTPSEIEPFAVEIPNSGIVDELVLLAKKNSLYIVAGVAEKDKGRLFNSSFYVGPEGYIGKYQKIHLFYREKEVFSAGEVGFNVFDGDFKLGMMVCFDWIYPESCRTLALKGAQIVAHATNLVLPFCPEAMLFRSLENRIFSITCNRTGTEKNGNEEHTFIGMSQVVSPKAERLISAGRNEESLKMTEIDVSQAEAKMITPFNDILKDRKPEYYA